MSGNYLVVQLSPLHAHRPPLLDELLRLLTGLRRLHQRVQRHGAQLYADLGRAPHPHHPHAALQQREGDVVHGDVGVRGGQHLHTHTAARFLLSSPRVMASAELHSTANGLSPARRYRLTLRW